MKLKAIAALFAKNKRLIIHTTADQSQWLSNGYAMYVLSGLPHMSTDGILRVFDVPEDKRKAWHCEESGIPKTINIAEALPGEEQIEPLATKIIWQDDTFWLFQEAPRQIHAIREALVKPLLDEIAYITYWKRATTDGNFMLAIKKGLELKAIIAPTLLHKYELHRVEATHLAEALICMHNDERQKNIYDLAAHIWGEILGHDNDEQDNTDPDQTTLTP
jgi:hypothetical protein